MKKNTPKPNEKNAGIPARIYFDAEADGLLNQLAVELDMPRSNIVCALVRALSGRPARTGQEKVGVKLKRVFGRDHMRAFLRSVADLVGRDATPIGKPNDTGEEFIPSAWDTNHGYAVVAFFHPSQENLGEVFSQALNAKNATGQDRVVVVCPSAEVAPANSRETLQSAGIYLVTASLYQQAVKRLFPR